MYGVIIKENRGNFKYFISEHYPDADFSIYRPNYNLASTGNMKYDDFMRLFGFTDSQKAKREYIEKYLTFDPEFIDFANQYKSKNVRFALLSNDISEWSEYIRDFYNIGKYFDFCVVSGDVGIRKPERAIFELTLKKCNCDADDCFLIDDNINNLQIAEELGMNAILFNRNTVDYWGIKVFDFKELSVKFEMLK